MGTTTNEPVRTCPPPTPLEHLRAGDRIRYQSNAMREEREGTIETISPKGLITLADGRSVDGPTSYVLLVEMGATPPLTPGGSGLREADHALRRAFVEAVGTVKAQNPDCLYETCVADVAGRIEFRDLRAATISSYYWWRDRYCLSPPQVERRKKTAAKTAAKKAAKKVAEVQYFEILTTETARGECAPPTPANPAPEKPVPAATVPPVAADQEPATELQDLRNAIARYVQGLRKGYVVIDLESDVVAWIDRSESTAAEA
jgi:hypothetical protein